MDEHTVHRQITIANTRAIEACSKMILTLSEQDLKLVKTQRIILQVQGILITALFILNATLAYHIWAGH